MPALPPFDAAQALRLARETFEIEAAALTALAGRLDARFADAVQRVRHAREPQYARAWDAGRLAGSAGHVRRWRKEREKPHDLNRIAQAQALAAARAFCCRTPIVYGSTGTCHN